MISEFDRVVLTRDLPEFGLEAGDTGVVVLIHDGGKAFEVEFMTMAGDTVAVVTLHDHEVRTPESHDIPHARALTA